MRMIGNLKDRIRPYVYSFIARFGADKQTFTVSEREITMHTQTVEECYDFYRFNQTHSEPQVLNCILKNIPSDGVFIDVGAKVGLYTVVVGVARPTTNILAVEPHPNNAQRCRDNLSLNRVEADVLEIAASGDKGDVELHSVDTRPGTGTHSIAEAKDSTQPVTVNKRTLDDVVEEYDISTIHVLKIDVEGGEMEVLNGMNNILRSNIVGNIIVEVHPHRMPETREQYSKDSSFANRPIEKRLLNSGYSVRRINERSNEYHILAQSDR